MGKESFTRIFDREAADNAANTQHLGDLQRELSGLKKAWASEVDDHKAHVRYFGKYGIFVQELPTKI